jgi:3alpha(or 20beta)-hydroxysteroid dehydrogenase
VLITGGARGQGAAAARAVIAEGGTVLIGDVLDDLGRALAASLGAAATFVHLDVTSEADWERATTAADGLGGLHGLVNNAGVYVPRSLEETDTALWQHHVDVNQFGVFLGMRACVPVMERSGGGSIVNVASAAALRGSQRAFAYCATKWALRGMTRSAARELAAKNIRVNCVCPGVVDTEMISQWSTDERTARLGAIPMQRAGTAEEMAELILFLLSSKSAYMTGAEIAADGGLTA